MQAEVYELDSWREGDGPPIPYPGEAGRPYVEGLRNRVRTVTSPLPLFFPTGFKAGETITVSLDAAGPYREPVLHYRHVNQAERWSSMPMDEVGGRYGGTIPADYTDTTFHIQFYVTVT